MVAVPSAASESGKSRPAAAAASCTRCSGQPASTVIVSLTGSTARTRFMRVSDSTMARPLSSGVPPPTRPVLPPSGTTGVRVSAQAFITAATSSVVAGRHDRLRAPV